MEESLHLIGRPPQQLQRFRRLEGIDPNHCHAARIWKKWAISTVFLRTSRSAADRQSTEFDSNCAANAEFDVVDRAGNSDNLTKSAAPVACAPVIA
jgi:hypothetical protein